jgi:hypothetical protein
MPLLKEGETEDAHEYVLCTYIEVHVDGNSRKRRLTTAVFRRASTSEIGFGYQWAHVHETWIVS